MDPYYEDDAVTLYHGDVFATLEAAGHFDAIITDPPYSSGGSFRSDRQRGTVEKYSSAKVVYRHEFAGDNRDQRSYLAWSTLWLGAALYGLRGSGSAMIFTDWRQLPTVSDAVQCAGLMWCGVGVWDKEQGRPNPHVFRSSVEYIVHARKGSAPTEDEPHYPTTAFRCPPPVPMKRQHMTEKPIAVLEWLMPFCPPGGVVLDPFCGAGGTLVAAKNTGRKAIGGDIDEHWCEVTAERLAQGVIVL